jgi:hypothetical protein
VSTGALIRLGQPRTLSSVPSLGEWRADACHERLDVERGCPPGRSAGRYLDATVLERFPVICVYSERACSLAGDIGRQPSLVLSGIAKGEVAGWTGRMPRVAQTQREPLVPCSKYSS